MQVRFMVAGLYLLAASACGRVAFDATAPDVDAPPTPACTTGHDEDADGIDDGCDTCPHIADATQADGDGDTVGDACDPNPAAPTETIAFFDPIVGGLAPSWTVKPSSVPATFDGDSIYGDARGAAQLAFTRSYTPATDTWTIGGRFGMSSANMARQMAIAFGTTGVETYYCELFGNPTSTGFLATRFNGTTYTGIDSMLVLLPLENGAFTMTVRHRPSIDFACTSSWAGSGMPVQTIPGWTADELAVFGGNFELTIDYVIQIVTE